VTNGRSFGLVGVVERHYLSDRMAPTPGHPIALASFAAILVGVCTAAVAGVHVATAKQTGDGRRATRAAVTFGIGLGVWLAIVSTVVASGVLEAWPFPWVPLFLAACNLLGLGVALSPLGRRLALGLPLGALVGFQAFRLPLELVLHDWASTNTVPVTMTWTGANFDVVSGIVALAAAPFAHKSRAVPWIANVVGLGLLLNVGRVAILSSPLPFAWPLEHPLVLAFHLPYALIVPVCVAGALAGHILLTRRLLHE
jgi:hypothetical protein